MAGVNLEVFALLNGDTDDVIDAVAGVTDHVMLLALDIAERRGRRRPKVLKAILDRGLVVEGIAVAQAENGDSIRISEDGGSNVVAELREAVRGLSAHLPVWEALPEGIIDEDPFPVPHVGTDFVDPELGREHPFMLAPDLEEIARGLVDRYPSYLGDVNDWNVGYLWSASSLSHGGRSALAITRRLSGELKFFSGFDFLVIGSALNLMDYSLNFYQANALVFHELRHIGTSEKYQPIIVPHDAEVSFAELEVFGPWRAGLARLADQGELPGFMR